MGLATYTYNRSTSGGEIITHLINSSDGQGLHFADGGYIDLVNAAGAEFGTSDFTIEFILDQDGDNTHDNWIYYTQIGGNNRAYFFNDISENVIKITFLNSSGAASNYTLAYDMSADYGTPTHYAFTFDRSGNVELYKNANSVAATSLSGSSAIDLGDGNTTGGRIGDPTTGYTVLGTFYRFRTWNKALTAAEVTASYENASVPFADQYGSQTSLVDAAASVFTSGTYNWAAWAGNSIANVSNTLAITYGSNALGAYDFFSDAKDLTTNLTVGKRYRLTADAKYTGGSAGVRLNVYDGISANTYSAPLTTSLVTYDIEFTAQHATGAYISLDSMGASNVVTIDNWYLREIGCVADYDLAFANPTQSLMVQDRAGAADGTASATGVAQVTPIEAVNTNKLNVGGTTPLVGIGVAAGSTPSAPLEVVGNVRANVSNAGGFYLTADTGVVRNNATGVAVRTAGADRLIVDTAGLATFNADATLKSAAGAQTASTLNFLSTNYGSFGSTYSVDSKIVSLNTDNSNAYGSELQFYTNDSANNLTKRLTIDQAGNTLTQSATFPVTTSERDAGSGTTGASGALVLRTKTTGVMANGFGSEMQFRVTDADNTNVPLAAINATRQTDDTSGQLVFRTYKTGSGVDRLTIDEDGNAGLNTSAPNESSFGSDCRVLSLQGAAADGFGALELITPDVTSTNRLGEIRFVNLDGSASTPAAYAGIRATRDGADDATKLSFWTEPTGGSITERLSIDAAGLSSFAPATNTAGINVTTAGDPAYGVKIDSAGAGITNPSLWVYNNGASSGPLAFLEQDHTSGTNDVLKIQNDGSGRSIYVEGGGIVEKDGVLKENLLTNSGFDVWSNSTLVSSVTGAAPAAADAGDLVNAATAGSGTAWTGATGATPPNGWSANWAGIFTIDSSSGSGAEPALKIEVNSTPTVDPGIVDSWTVEVGKLYQFSFRFKNSPSATGGIVYLGTSLGGTQYNRWDPTSGTWATYSFTFEATTATVHAGLRCDASSAGLHCWYDSVMLHEVTPGCVAADALAFDGWIKSSTLDIYREHWNGSGGDSDTTKTGSFYALKSAASVQYESVTWPNATLYDSKEFTRKFAGRKVTFGFWCKTSTANDVVCRVYDDVANTTTGTTTYCPNDGNWNWMETTATISNSGSLGRVYFAIQHRAASPGTAYISQPMLCFSSAIGEGNYSAPSGEIVMFEKLVNSTGYFTTGFSDVSGTLNVEADSNGCVPKGANGLFLDLGGQDSGSAGTDTYFRCGASSTLGFVYANTYGLANDALLRNSTALCKCDSNGDIEARVEASGSGTFDAYLQYAGVQLR